MFRKLLLLSFIVATASNYAANQDRQAAFEATIKELEKKVNIIVGNVLEVADILIDNSILDEMTEEESDMLISLLEKQLAKIKKKENEITGKVSKQDIYNRIKMLENVLYFSMHLPY